MNRRGQVVAFAQEAFAARLQCQFGLVAGFAVVVAGKIIKALKIALPDGVGTLPCQAQVTHRVVLVGNQQACRLGNGLRVGHRPVIGEFQFMQARQAMRIFRCQLVKHLPGGIQGVIQVKQRDRLELQAKMLDEFLQALRHQVAVRIVGTKIESDDVLAAGKLARPLERGAPPGEKALAAQCAGEVGHQAVLQAQGVPLFLSMDTVSQLACLRADFL